MARRRPVPVPESTVDKALADRAALRARKAALLALVVLPDGGVPPTLEDLERDYQSRQHRGVRDAF